MYDHHSDEASRMIAEGRLSPNDGRTMIHMEPERPDESLSGKGKRLILEKKLNPSDGRYSII
jgi:hypothetical protein